MDDFNITFSEDFIASIVGSINFKGLIIYRAMYVIGFILMMLFNVLIYYKVFNVSRLRAAVYSVLTFAYGLLGGLLVGDLYNALAAIKGMDPLISLDMIGSIVFFLLLIPTAYAEKYFLKLIARKKNGELSEIKTVSSRDTLDFAVPGGIIFLACIKIGCCFAGCCYGVESSWGFQVYGTDITRFPIQAFEFATLYLILFATYFIQQTKFYRRGMAAPIAASMYFFARFCWEFLRGYTPERRHFFLGLTLWQIFCVIIFIVVATWAIVLYKTQPSEPMPKNYLFAKSSKKNVSSMKNTNNKKSK